MDEYQRPHKQSEEGCDHRSEESKEVVVEPVFRVPLVDYAFHEANEQPDGFYKLQNQKSKEVLPVFLSYTVANPGTVVVISSHTPIAVSAMLSP